MEDKDIKLAILGLVSRNEGMNDYSIRAAEKAFQWIVNGTVPAEADQPSEGAYPFDKPSEAQFVS